MLNKIVIFALALLAISLSPTANALSNYNAGLLSLSVVQVGNKLYSAELDLIDDQLFIFQVNLTSLKDITDTTTADASDPVFAVDILTIPEVQAGKPTYSATLELIDPDLLTFQLSSVILVFANSPCPDIKKVNYAGKIYNTVLIGKQCWLQENLDIGKMLIAQLRVGTSGIVDNQKDNAVIEKYCYENKPENCITYGGLYSWGEAMQYKDSEGSQGICPKGWHIPTQAEFETLKDTVGGDGDKLKATEQGGTATYSSGFSALFAGRRNTEGGLAGFSTENGYFFDLGEKSLMISSTAFNNSLIAYTLHLYKTLT